MEIKINREVRKYEEEIFFGLTMRQFLCSACACASAVGMYFLCTPHMGKEYVSWVCIAGAVPFAVLGFVTYQGMTAEQLFIAWFKYTFLVPRRLLFGQKNYYYLALEPVMKKRWRESIDDKNSNEKKTEGKGAVPDPQECAGQPAGQENL